MDYAKESLRLHEEWKGKIRVDSAVPVKTMQDLSLAYTPGVAQPCLEIQKDISKSYDLTRRWNICAVITDGSAVLGLGDIRSGGRYASNGGQVRALQGIWRCGCLPYMRKDKGC